MRYIRSSHLSHFVHESLSPWKTEAMVSHRIYDCREQPTFDPNCKLWLYGNLNLLRSPLALAPSCFDDSMLHESRLATCEHEAEGIVLTGRVLVCGVHNEFHQRAAVVPLRWGAPRIIVFSGGFLHHLGADLDQEPFRAARLWRYAFDPTSDLVVSLRAPDKLPTYSRKNPTVDRLIRKIADETLVGLPAVDRQAKFLF